MFFSDKKQHQGLKWIFVTYNATESQIFPSWKLACIF